MKTFENLAELAACVGQDVAATEWVTITQQQVNQFAEATGDHQWIHVDVERAKAESPFGGPIAHGYLTLSLGPVLMPQILSVSGVKMGVNYGLGKVRFVNPVPVGSRLRLGAALDEVKSLDGGWAQIHMTFTFEIEGADKPACVAEIIFRYAE
jgi:acyl dehydratase